MNKERSRKQFKDMYDDLINPERQEERAQQEQRRKIIEDKKTDTGYA